MHVGLAVAIGVAQSPNAIAIKHVNLPIANCDRHRFVQARRKAPPMHRVRRIVEPTREPDIPINRDHHAGAVRQKLNISGAHST